MNLQFNAADVSMAQSFADKAKLHQNSPVAIASLESENDSLEVGDFCITKVADTKVTKSILGEHSVEAVAFVVTAELQEYSSDIGYNSDVVDIAREWTLRAALKACAHAELDWKLKSMEF